MLIKVKPHRWLVMTSLLLIGGCSSKSTVPSDTSSPPQDPPAIEVPEVRVGDLKGWNVVVLVVDSLRADRLGCYGNPTSPTPFLDQLSNEGLLFENAYANSSYIGQSLSALLTGRLPTSGGTVGMFEAHPLDNTITLAQQFGASDYYTGIVTNQSLVRGSGFTRGFEEVQIASPEESVSGSELSQRALEFVEDAGDDPFFLYVHYREPHQPYDPPAEFLRNDATALDMGAFRRDYANSIREIDDTNDPAVQALTARYDAEIAYTDECIRQFVTGLEERGVRDSTLLVITSSHGEEFLEHGYLGHAWTVFNEVLHVPLLVLAPEKLPHVRVPLETSLVDITPSLLALTGIGYDPSLLDGTSLFETRGTERRLRGTSKPVIAELVVTERAIVRAVIHNQWKYIAASQWHAPERRYEVAISVGAIVNALASGEEEPPPAWGGDAYEALFNLYADPAETNNLLAENPEKAKELAQALLDYQRRCEQYGLEPRQIAGMMEVLDPEDIENLESLGYL